MKKESIWRNNRHPPTSMIKESTTSYSLQSTNKEPDLNEERAFDAIWDVHPFVLLAITEQRSGPPRTHRAYPRSQIPRDPPHKATKCRSRESHQSGILKEFPVQNSIQCEAENSHFSADRVLPCAAAGLDMVTNAHRRQTKPRTKTPEKFHTFPRTEFSPALPPVE